MQTLEKQKKLAKLDKLKSAVFKLYFTEPAKVVPINLNKEKKIPFHRMITTNILIVNHNIDEAKTIKSRLVSSTTNAVCAHTIEEALDAFSRMEFCLVILDSAMFASDDHNILKAMRSAKTMPILVLSSHADHTERIHAFQAGAHAYMGKPYTEEECLAQAHTLMQLYIDMNPQKDEICYTLAFGKELIIEPETRQVKLQGRELRLTRKEYDLLFWLASNPGKVFSCGQLYDHVWDEFAIGNVDDVVKYHIKSLRKKLTVSSAEYIKNVWGIGYRFANVGELRSNKNGELNFKTLQGI